MVPAQMKTFFAHHGMIYVLFGGKYNDAEKYKSENGLALHGGSAFGSGTLTGASIITD